MFIFSYYHLVIFDGFEKDSDLFMLFFMWLHKIEVSNFNIASMGKEFGPRNIFLIEFNCKFYHRAGEGWTGKPLVYN